MESHEVYEHTAHMSYELGVFAANVAAGRVKVEGLFQMAEWFSYVAVLGFITTSFIEGFNAEVENIRRDGDPNAKPNKDLLANLISECDDDFQENVLHVLFGENEVIAPCPVGRGDEVFTFLATRWNITALKRFLEDPEQNHDIKTQFLDPQQLAPQLSLVHVNERHALEQPDSPLGGILVELQDGSYLLIDGANRLYKAIHDHKATFPVYMVPFKTQLRFLIDHLMIDNLLQQKRKTEWEEKRKVTA